ncbi:DUF3226 domain-containing protein [Thermococcus piezophilus]|uniref:DUF3226 domain-containing protein n=1 Tax=Thermococcus piezophilus TaxID=1712654 RepID=A0A172WH86_9EURY|nr:DUF3226 domain-containing protein [Thermococcus piezophilus]ANF22760.1 hypothetical protein A7C91_05935 [Thermococcus piezophilus]
MRIITGKRFEAFADENALIFQEYGKNRRELVEIVGSLTGDETVVTASLELIDLILSRFKSERHFLIYSDTGKTLTTREAYELRKYLEFDLRGGFTGGPSLASVLFVEGKTDAKFFKAVFKKLYEFKESREVPANLKFIERVFKRENFELLRNENGFLAVIPSEGNSGVIRNLGNFIRAMEVFEFSVDKIGVAIDVDDNRESAMASITGKLSLFYPEKTATGFRVGKTEVIPLIIGLPFEDELIEWKKPTVEDLMLHLIAREGLLERIRPALRTLNESLGRTLKPKEIMYLALSAYGHWGNLEGFYELFVMRSRFRNIKAVLREAGLMEGLFTLSGKDR